MSSYIACKFSCFADTQKSLTGNLSAKQTFLLVVVDETFRPISDVVTTPVTMMSTTNAVIISVVCRELNIFLFKSIFKFYLGDIFL